MQAARNTSMGFARRDFWRGVHRRRLYPPCVAPRRERNSANSARIAQRLVAAILEILIEPPALDLRQSVVEFLPGQRPVIQPLATAELRITPRMEILQFGPHRDLPQR